MFVRVRGSTPAVYANAPRLTVRPAQEIIPIMLCAISQHPDAAARDQLVHLLFNLVKRPDEGQREIIMNACMALAQVIGPERVANELLPQCWEQVRAAATAAAATAQHRPRPPAAPDRRHRHRRRSRIAYRSGAYWSRNRAVPWRPTSRRSCVIRLC